MSRRRVVATLALTIAVAAVLSGCVGKRDVLKIENTTDALSSEGAEASGVLYWLPATTDFSAMPVGDVGTDESCSATMTAWLSEHADRVMFPQKIRFTNVSNESQTVTLVAEGSRPDAKDAKPAVGVSFQCGRLSLAGRAGEGELEWHDVIYNITEDENKDATTPDQQGPFSVTLAPGGTVGAFVMFAGEQPFDGQLRASSSASDVTTQTVPILSGSSPQGSFKWPGIKASTVILVHPQDNDLRCRLGPSDPSDPGETCSSSQIAAFTQQLESMKSGSEFPSEIQGKWCTKSGDKCFDLADERSEFPGLFLDSQDKSEKAGAKSYALCLDDDLTRIRNGEVHRDCSTAMTMYLTYFPAGVAWDCGKYARGGCKPDYTKDHDTSEERLVIELNHQQGEYYNDMPPMYRIDQ